MAGSSLVKLKDSFKVLKKDYTADLSPASSSSFSLSHLTNNQKRTFYSQLGLLELDLEALTLEDNNERQILASLLEEIADISKKLNLSVVAWRSNTLYSRCFEFFDEIVRILAVWTFLIDAALLISLPIFVLLIVAPKSKLHLIAKLFIGRSILTLSAISLSIENCNPNVFENKRSVVCFSHASTMDARTSPNGPSN